MTDMEIIALLPQGVGGLLFWCDENNSDVFSVSKGGKTVDIAIRERDKALSPDDFRKRVLTPALVALDL